LIKFNIILIMSNFPIRLH